VDVILVFFGFLLLAGLAVFVALFLFVAIGHRSLTRSNRIVPAIPTQAPLIWRWSIGVSARHHRRLQRIAALSRASAAAAGVGGVGVGELAADIERQACALDDQLALARHLPTSQRVRRLFDLDRAIAELEQLSMRVTILAGEVSSPAGQTSVPLAERITHLEEAVAEVRRIEAEALGEARALGQGVFYPPLPVTSRREPEPAPLRRPRH
jgi:hypothetical protein